MYITRTEESYLHFDKAAEEFVHESPTLLLDEAESSSANAYSMHLDNQVSSHCVSQASSQSNQLSSNSNQLLSNSINSMPVNSINSMPINSNQLSNNATSPTSQLPLVATGLSRARSRSYSIELVTRNSSSLKPDRSDQITVASLAHSDAGRADSPRERLHSASPPLSLRGGASSEALSRAGDEAQGAAAEGALRGDAVQGAEAVVDDGEAIYPVSARALLHRLLHVRHPQDDGRPQRPVSGVDGRLRHADPRVLPETGGKCDRSLPRRRSCATRWSTTSRHSSTASSFRRCFCSRCRSCSTAACCSKTSRSPASTSATTATRP